MIRKSLLALAALSLISAAAFADQQTISFTGDGDLYGLSRQTSDKEANLEFVTEFSFTEEGIDFAAEATGAGKGFALVNAGDAKNGIFVSERVDTKLTLTVPGGRITGAQVRMTGYALFALELTFNDVLVESVSENAYNSWTWNSEEGSETLTITWPLTYMPRYIRAIELTYTPDLGGKQECGLSFGETTAELVMDEAFTAPVLSNPNNLPIVWSSSDEAVATVDADGKVTGVGGGTAIITAATEGNEEFAGGNAKYTLTVIPVAENIAQMKELAPALNDQVKANFPATVVFASTNYAFVLDAENNPALFEDSRNEQSTTATAQIYKVGDVIPGGWIAKNNTIYESVIWKGIPGDVTEQVEVTYPVYEEVTPADADRVVILEEVEFKTRTPHDLNKVYGTTPNGKTYQFQNPYGAPEKPAGVYNVTVVVRYSKVGSTEYFFLAPIAFADPSGLSTVETSASEVRYFNLQGQEVARPESGVLIRVADGQATKVLL